MEDYEGAEEIDRAWREGLTPDPLLSVSEWSDQHRMLSSKASAEPGRWRTSRTPYLRDIMDCLSPTSPVERVVFMKAAQVGAIGALFASRMRQVRDLRLMLLACYLIQAAGVALSLAIPTLLGFAIGSLLVGLPFTAITYFGMQEARRIRPHHLASTIGLLTALYGLGQILGPPMAAYLLKHAATPAAGFDLALEIAAGSLLLGAALFGVLVREYPVSE